MIVLKWTELGSLTMKMHMMFTDLCSYHNLFSFYTAKEVLEDFHDQFIEVVDADAIVHQFEYKKVINDATKTNITQHPGRDQKNGFLYGYLIKYCTETRLLVACEEMIAVKGNAKMNRLGEQMKEKLKGE